MSTSRYCNSQCRQEIAPIGCISRIYGINGKLYWRKSAAAKYVCDRNDRPKFCCSLYKWIGCIFTIGGHDWLTISVKIDGSIRYSRALTPTTKVYIFTIAY